MPAKGQKTGMPAHNRADTPLDEIEKLASFGLTIKEIAQFYGVDPAGFYTSAERKAAFDKGQSNLKISLKRKQMSKALEGDVKMLIWLGKQYLDQKEPPREISGVDGKPIMIETDGIYEKLRLLLLSKVEE